MWAEKNTPHSSVFIRARGGSWRTFSHRRLFVSNLNALFSYTRSKTTKRQNDNLLKFYRLDDINKDMKIQELTSIVEKKFYSLTPQDIVKFAREFGGDYIIYEIPLAKRSIDKPLNFPIVYENNELIIHKIPLQ